MTVPQLLVRYQELFGVPTRARNKDCLRRRLAWRVQELAGGGLSSQAETKLSQLEAELPVEWLTALGSGEEVGQTKSESAEQAGPESRDDRIPAPGTILRREHGGKVYEVTILEQGFQVGDTVYSTLTATANAITGKKWNGYNFFKNALAEVAATNSPPPTNASAGIGERPPSRRPSHVAMLLAFAHAIQRAFDFGTLSSTAQLARVLGMKPIRLGRLQALTLLAPDIQERLLFLEAVYGAEPLSERCLRPLVATVDWNAQRRMFACLVPMKTAA